MNDALLLFVGLLAGLAAGGLGGFLLRQQRDKPLLEQAEQDANNMRKRAEEDADRTLARAEREREEIITRETRRLEDDITRNAKTFEDELNRARGNLEQDFARMREELNRDRQELRRDREKLDNFEERLTRRGEQQDARALKLDGQEEHLDQRAEELRGLQAELDDKHQAADAKLYEVAQLSKDQATDIIFEQLNQALEREKAVRIRDAIEKADAEAKRKATDIISQAIQRNASEISASVSVSVVPIPSDNMKGRIIGREGRNIRAFEALTGVDLIIDDTPEAVLLSSFNPIRREVAQIALSELVRDGRIHPSRIEEMVQKAQQDMQAYIREKGEEAALEANVVGLKPGLLQLLGRMHFRTSFGQNVLKHSVQVAHLTGIIAAELGLDATMARRAGLLHDIGKSIDREIEGTHTEIGATLARRFGEPDDVIDAIANHHDLDLAETLFPVIVSAADAISAARPGARRESLETYIKRLKELETIAQSFPGVEKSYAIQAGRELRVIVEPQNVNDASAVLLARDVANRIEQDMEYPGQVQVTVVRESRAVEYAR
ncbi:MAG: ribonuclease Y [Deinococcota bacterium]